MESQILYLITIRESIWLSHMVDRKNRLWILNYTDAIYLGLNFTPERKSCSMQKHFYNIYTANQDRETKMQVVPEHCLALLDNIT